MISNKYFPCRQILSLRPWEDVENHVVAGWQVLVVVWFITNGRPFPYGYPLVFASNLKTIIGLKKPRE